VTLAHDPLWPRAGGYPVASAVEGELDAALVGIPTWRTSLTPGGAGETPAAVREALRRYSAYRSPDRGVTEGVDAAALSIADFGDVDDPHGEAGEARAVELVEAARQRARLVVALGGDNALTVPAALGGFGDQAATAGLITFDAHHDLRDGASNGSPIRRLIEEFGVDGRRVVQIGIADFANSPAYAARAAEFGITVIHRDELYRRPIEDVVAEALEIAGSAGGPIHVDVDVDVCDRSVAPGCPASVPGGLSAYELRRGVRAAAGHAAVGTIDFAEVDATADAPDHRTVRLAALCVLEAFAALAGRG
jgi:formiminoglutamase